MPTTSTSREVLNLSQSESSLSGRNRNGIFISKPMFLLIGGLFVTTTICSTLLAYYMAPSGGPSLQNDVITPSSAKQAEPEIDLRLPQSIKPIDYVLKLIPFINGNFNIDGNVQIDMKVEESTSVVTLHILDIITHNDTVKITPIDEKGHPGIKILTHEYDPVRQFYIIHLDEDLQQDKNYRLTMDYTGYLNDKLAGFYRSEYTTESGEKRLIATTQFEATDARRAFPCFDEPAMKATFQINIARQKNMTAIANMPLEKTTPVEGQADWFWDEFQRTVPMSTYLVAFVVSDFVSVNSTENKDVLFRVWAREGAIQQTEYALDIGPKVLEFYSSYFDIPFPLPKQDMIAIPDFSAGAMENWGLVTYREVALLYQPGVSSAANKQYVAIVVAHELAHQWFGNLVSPKWWSDLWLNEGFASYMEYLGTNSVAPHWNILDQFLEVLHDVFGLDCLESSHPISVEVKDPNEINELFDGISYDKGASIIRMMNHFLTEETFRQALHNYLEALKFSNAEQDDLWHYLTEQAHNDNTLLDDLDVKTIMDSWTLQKGYPVVTVTRNQDNTATVMQERFKLVETENSTDTHEYLWWVPLTFTTEDTPNFEETKCNDWLSTKSKVLENMPSEDKWVIFNIQETGFYRVNYEESNWNLLIGQLHKDLSAIHIKNRAQLLDDSLNLARSGRLSYDIALDVVSYLDKETEYVPWNAAFSSLAYMEVMFTRKGGYGKLKNYFLSMLIPLYKTVGFDDDVEDPLLEVYTRDLAVSWVCKLRYEDCVENSVKLFDQWMADPTNTSIISPNQKSVVYCTAIREGTQTEWDFLWDQYLTTNVGTEKDKILTALGCTSQVWILAKYLEMAFDPDSGIRRQDASHAFYAVARNDAGQDLAWNYIENEWEYLTEYFGTFTALSDMISVVTNEFNTRQKLHELELFKEEHEGELFNAARGLDQSIERTKNNIDWMDKNYDIIYEWLDKNGF